MSQYVEIPALFQSGSYVYNKAFERDGCLIWVTRDRHADNTVHWHMSISRRDRYPSWNEIRDARYELLPDNITMAMLLPPKDQYVDLHPNCFHLHEIENE
jgi:hypothetical protein